VSLAFFLGKEGTSGLADDGSTNVSPFNISWVLFSEESDLLSVD
jgi:hypothetical protein